MLDSATLFSFRLSLQVAGLATLLVLVSGIGMAYLLARKDFWGKELLDIFLTLPLVLPPTVTGLLSDYPVRPQWHPGAAGV